MNLISGLFGGGKKEGPSAGELAQQRDQKRNVMDDENKNSQILANQMNMQTLRKRLSLSRGGKSAKLG